MIDEVRVRQALAEILESPEFRDTQRYRELLQYLVEESLSGRTPKEASIGMRFFGKDASFSSKEDATVRVYLNNLRKKLEHYYLTAGKSASLKLDIPVGHYKVDFVTTDTKSAGGPKKQRWMLPTLIGCALLAVFVGGYYVGTLRHTPQTPPSVPNAIWDEFVQPNARPTLVVLGDYFFLRENNPVSSYYRTITINGVEDFEALVRKEPAFAKRYQPLQFTYLRPSASWGLVHILPILQKSPRGYSLKLASEFTTSDFKTNNIVFIGTLKTLYGIRKFLHIFGMRQTEVPYQSVAIETDKKDSARVFSGGGQFSGEYVRDFAIIAKGAGPEGSTIVLLLGVSEHGAIEAPLAACDSTLLLAVKSRYPQQTFSDPLYFTLVLSTEGISQTVFGTNILHFIQNKPLYNISSIGHEQPPAGN